MEVGWIVTGISVLAAIAGMVFGATNARRNQKKDDAEDGKEAGVILTELGYIKSSVDDIKRKQDRQEEQTMKFLADLTAVQESAKQAHKRIDAIEKRMNHES